MSLTLHSNGVTVIYSSTPDGVTVQQTVAVNGNNYTEVSNINVNAGKKYYLATDGNMSTLMRDLVIAPGLGLENMNTSLVTSMFAKFWFSGTRNAVQTEDISSWDTSNVTYMGYLFYGCFTFDGDISMWDTSNVTSMELMFAYCYKFNQPLNNWDTSQVQDMSYMFYVCEEFDQDLNQWDTSQVTTMTYMFTYCYKFNGSINDWDTSNVEDISIMFANCKMFNQPLYKWDTSKVTTLRSTFYGATLFNQPLNDWNTSNVTTMRTMFYKTGKFNQPLDNWDTSKVTKMHHMFSQSKSFNQNLSPSMKTRSDGTTYIAWDTRNVENFRGMFANSHKFNNGDLLGQSNKPLLFSTDSATNLVAMFMQARAFNQKIETTGYLVSGTPYRLWDTSNVTRATVMFTGAIKFNQDINNFDLSTVDDVRKLFAHSVAFNNGREKHDSTNPLKINFGPNANILEFVSGALSFSQDIYHILLRPYVHQYAHYDASHNFTGYVDYDKKFMLKGSNLGTNLPLLKSTLDLLGVTEYVNGYIASRFIDQNALLALINQGYNISMNIMDKPYEKLMEDKKNDNFTYINIHNGQHTLGNNEYVVLLDDEGVDTTVFNKNRKNFQVPLDNTLNPAQFDENEWRYNKTEFTIKHNGGSKPIILKGFRYFNSSVPLNIEYTDVNANTQTVNASDSSNEATPIELLSYSDIKISYQPDDYYTFTAFFGFDFRIAYFPNTQFPSIYPLTLAEVAGMIFGDPHIRTLRGELIELPFTPGKYRMVQGQDLTINLTTRRTNSEEKNEIVKLEQKFKRNLVSNGCYSDEIFINSEGNTFKYCFDTKKIYCSNPIYFRAENNVISFNHQKYGKINLILEKDKNVMMKNTSSLKMNCTEDLSGLLVQECLINSMRIDSLDDTSHKIPILSVNPVYSVIYNPNN